jgi:diguanylate cyclase (GGDEF)-like protein/PAS domain S-box-containing protein
MSMPVDPEVQARIAILTGVDPADAPSQDDRIAAATRAFATLALDGPAVRSAPIAIWSTADDGTIRSWNDMAAELLGWPAGDVLGHRPPFELQPAGPDGDRGPEHVGRHRDGHEVHLLVSSNGSGPSSADRAVTVWYATRLSDERAAARALELEHERWRRLLPSLAQTVVVVDERGLIRDITAELPTVLGHPIQGFIGSSSFALLDPADLERAWLVWERVLSNPGHEFRNTFRTRHADGHYEQIEYTVLNLVADPVVNGIVVTGRLVTAQVEYEALIASETEVLNLIARGAPLSDALAAIARIVDANTGGMTGVLLLRPDAREFDIGTSGAVPVALLELLRRAPLTPSLEFETIDFRRVTVISDLGTDRRTAPLAEATQAYGSQSAWSIPIIANRSDELLGLIAVFHHDERQPCAHERRVGETAAHLAAIAIERHRWQEQLWHQARHDDLTGLPNRHLILEHLDTALGVSPLTADQTVAVLFVDVDRFKSVNDSYGHAAGDKLLVRFAGRLRNVIGPHDFVGHFGADEFVIILDRASSAGDARFVAHRIDLALSEPFSLEEGEVYLTASIGVALATGGESSVELIQHADAAMARAKELGRDRMEVFDQVMRTRADEQLRIDRQLRAAVDNGELTIHYQPIVETRSGTVLGAEALLRWNHPDEGLLRPERFLAVAEDTGTIVRIGRWVIEQAVNQARCWVDRHPHLESFTISVNVSARQVASPGLVDHIARVLELHGWPPDQLSLELTEGILVEDRETSLAVLTDLKELGLSLAMDDFGTGFSSLNELHRFPLDAVKIDPSFVASLDADGDGSPVATAVLHMAHALGLYVIAEGVEKRAQLDGLLELRCDLAQGELLAPPGPPDEIERRFLVPGRINA